MKYLLALGLLGMANAGSTKNTYSPGVNATTYSGREYIWVSSTNQTCTDFDHEIIDSADECLYAFRWLETNFDTDADNNGDDEIYTGYKLAAPAGCAPRGTNDAYYGRTFYVTSTESTDSKCSNDYQCLCRVVSGGAPAVQGCTNPAACNYDASATGDDGSCATNDCNGVCGGPAAEDAIGVCGGSCAEDRNNNDICDVDPGTTCPDGQGPVQSFAGVYLLGNRAWDLQTGSYVAKNTPTECAVYCQQDGYYNFQLDSNREDKCKCAQENGFDHSAPGISIYDVVTVYDCIDDTQTTPDDTPGCMDASACNYDDSATEDDGSCEFTSCAGCTVPTACNYDASAIIDDGSCAEVDAIGVCDGSCVADADADGVCDDDGGDPCVGALDACGVCNGDDSSCADCDGVPNGDAALDACGVCGGDGSSCADPCTNPAATAAEYINAQCCQC